MKDALVQLPVGDDPPEARLLYGVDVREGLRILPGESVHCVVTSPPYWGLRDYGTEPSVWGGDPGCEHEWVEEVTLRKGSTNGRPDLGSTLVSVGGEKTLGPGLPNDRGCTAQYREDRHAVCRRCGAWRGQLGLEADPDLYVEHMVEVFREVRRVLREDGTAWLNLGDSYASVGGTGQPRHWDGREKNTETQSLRRTPTGNLKSKDLVGIPWRVALALQADGWWLRNAVIWRKVNHLPSPVQDRFSCTYEHIFLLTRSARYYFDLDAIRVPHTYGQYNEAGEFEPMGMTEGQLGTHAGPPRRLGRGLYNPSGKNPGDCWDFPTQPFPGSHFAVWPQSIPERCIRAATSAHGVCATCGTPWERVVEREDPQGNADPAGGPKAEASQEAREAGGIGRLDGGRRATEGSTFHNNPRRRTLPSRVFHGWEPGCDCGDERIGRAVVLDPFSGSGTTGRVALRLGRDYVGIDLKEEYLPMAVSRVRDEPPPEEPQPPPAGSVLDVFGREDD